MSAIAAESALPEAVAEQRLELRVVVGDRPAENRLAAEQVEQPRRHRDADDNLAVAVDRP